MRKLMSGGGGVDVEGRGGICRSVLAGGPGDGGMVEVLEEQRF
jgi:hypothetical protein